MEQTRAAANLELEDHTSLPIQSNTIQSFATPNPLQSICYMFTIHKSNHHHHRWLSHLGYKGGTRRAKQRTRHIHAAAQLSQTREDHQCCMYCTSMNLPVQP